MTAVGMVYNPVPEDKAQWTRPQRRVPQFQARYVAGLGGQASLGEPLRRQAVQVSRDRSASKSRLARTADPDKMTMNSGEVFASTDVMATQSGPTASTDAAIIARMIHPDEADLPEDAAEAVLKIFRLDQSDQDRLHDLLVRNQDDALTPAEKDELESYLRISLLIDLMHAKARFSLKKLA